MRLSSHPLYFIFHCLLKFLDHNSPHKDPPGEFVEKAARAADPSDAIDDDDDDDEEERISVGSFNNLVGAKTSGVNDLGYSSDDDEEDYDDGMDEEARRIDYSDSKHTALVVVRQT